MIEVEHPTKSLRYRPRDAELTLAPVDINRTLQQVIDLTRARWSDIPQERGIVIRMQTEFEANLPTIMGAEHEIRDALTNLILNAVDAMPRGGTILLRSRTQTRNASGPSVSVEVCDSGVGMSEAVRSQCLEPFFTTKGERGTGLGLAMVYGMVKRHSSELEIDSEPGAGTTMRLIFPVAAGASISAPQEVTAHSLRPLRLLIIDDDPLVLESLQVALANDGHGIALAEGGQAGIDAFVASQQQPERFSVVITDLGMPHVDGRTVASAIKTLAPETPIILLTGWGHRLLADNDIPEHIDRVLGKPPKLADLRTALAELTAGR
jgi:CheY-like chemotaxis protein